MLTTILTPQDLQVQYTNYKNALQQIAQKIGDVEQEADEHKLVLETLEPLPAERKCFRMINGVLIERTVQDVIPALKTNAEGLSKVLDDLVKQYKSRQEELEKWKVSSHGPWWRSTRGRRRS
jgi:prefoldin subunit 2